MEELNEISFWGAIAAIAVAFFGGAGVSALINAGSERWKFKAQRKATKEDRAEEKADKTNEIRESIEEFKKQETKRNEEIEKQMAALAEQQAAQSEALKLILIDRILHLGQGYIAKGEVSFDDRRRLHEMHDCYHNRLKGNGDANLVMEGVDELQLKK